MVISMELNYQLHVIRNRITLLTINTHCINPYVYLKNIINSVMRLITVITACLCWMGLVVNGENFHPDRTRLIDTFKGKNYTNYLFRGNMPIIDRKFGYNELMKTLGEVLQKHNLTLPSSYYMLDVSYINSYIPGEKGDFQAEKEFWEENSEKGQLLHWPIVGSTIRPPGDNTVIKGIINHYMKNSLDRLDIKLPVLHRALTTEYSDVSWLIYTHCEAGVDRTGEVSGAYYMQFLNMTFEDAVKVDNTIVNRDMYEDSRNELQWYCYYLKFEKGMKDLVCV